MAERLNTHDIMDLMRGAEPELVHAEPGIGAQSCTIADMFVVVDASDADIENKIDLDDALRAMEAFEYTSPKVKNIPNQSPSAAPFKRSPPGVARKIAAGAIPQGVTTRAAAVKKAIENAPDTGDRHAYVVIDKEALYESVARFDFSDECRGTAKRARRV